MEYLKADQVSFDPRPQMSRIFVEGFYDHGLKHFSKDKATLAKAMAHIFDLSRFYLAMADGQIAAMIGCTDKKPPPIKLNKTILVKELGLLRGQIAYRGLTKYIINHPYPFELSPQTGSIEFVATAPEHRGKGAAFGLLSHIMQTLPYTAYVLEVIDHNTPAIRLYQKLGFAEFKRTPAPKRSGFKHYIYMKVEMGDQT